MDNLKKYLTDQIALQKKNASDYEKLSHQALGAMAQAMEALKILEEDEQSQEIKDSAKKNSKTDAS